MIATDIVPSAINSKHRIAIVCSARSGATKATGTTNLLLRAALEALRPRSNDLSSSISSFTTPAGTPGPSASTDKLNPLTSQIFQRSASQAPLNGGDSKAGSTHSGTSTPGGSLAQSLLGLRGGEEGPQQFNATVDQIKHDHIEAARVAVKNAAILAELEDDLDYDCERLRSFLLAAQVSMNEAQAELVRRSADLFRAIRRSLTRFRRGRRTSLWGLASGCRAGSSLPSSATG